MKEIIEEVGVEGLIDGALNYFMSPSKVDIKITDAGYEANECIREILESYRDFCDIVKNPSIPLEVKIEQALEAKIRWAESLANVTKASKEYEERQGSSLGSAMMP